MMGCASPCALQLERAHARSFAHPRYFTAVPIDTSCNAATRLHRSCNVLPPSATPPSLPAAHLQRTLKSLEVNASARERLCYNMVGTLRGFARRGYSAGACSMVGHQGGVDVGVQAARLAARQQTSRGQYTAGMGTQGTLTQLPRQHAAAWRFLQKGKMLSE